MHPLSCKSLPGVTLHLSKRNTWAKGEEVPSQCLLELLRASPYKKTKSKGSNQEFLPYSQHPNRSRQKKTQLHWYFFLGVVQGDCKHLWFTTKLSDTFISAALELNASSWNTALRRVFCSTANMRQLTKPVSLMSRFIINGTGEQNVPCKCHACGCWPFQRQQWVNNTSFENYCLHTFKSWAVTAPKGAIKLEQENDSYWARSVIIHSEGIAWGCSFLPSH